MFLLNLPLWGAFLASLLSLVNLTDRIARQSGYWRRDDDDDTETLVARRKWNCVIIPVCIVLNIWYDATGDVGVFIGAIASWYAALITVHTLRPRAINEESEDNGAKAPLIPDRIEAGERKLREREERAEALAEKEQLDEAERARVEGAGGGAGRADVADVREIPYEDLTFRNRIGEGGFGVVFRGIWEGVTVAIKKITAPTLSATTLSDIRREAGIMAKMRHENIVALYAICLSGPYCLVMEFMAGGSLFDKLHSRDALTWAQNYRIARDICAGLMFLHNHRTLHRDLKSHNVVLREDLHAKLTDFGLAKVRSETVSRTTRGIKGTPAWMAPEVCKGEKITEKSDVYSLGMILWELSSRQIPFSEAVHHMMIFAWLIAGKKESIPERTPSSYAALIRQCWKTEPRTRPTAEAVFKALHGMEAELEACRDRPGR